MSNATQPQSALSMMQFIYLWLPFVFDLLITIVLSQMNVEETNANIRKARGMSVERAEELFEKASL